MSHYCFWKFVGAGYEGNISYFSISTMNGWTVSVVERNAEMLLSASGLLAEAQTVS